MACNAENANERSQNGRVFAVNLTDKDKFRALAPADARGDDNLGQVLWNPSEGTRSTLSWYWEPPLVEDVAPRILRQHSLFVFGHPILPEQHATSVAIAAESKDNILETLALQHDLSRESLFRDINGFAAANKRLSRVRRSKTSADYFRDAKEAFKKRNCEKAIRDLDEAVYLSPQGVKAHVGRAHCWVGLGLATKDPSRYERALSDYGIAIDNMGRELRQEDIVLRAAILHDRGNVRAQLGDLKGSVQDYSASCDAPDNPSFLKSHAYFNRGNAYFKMQRWDEAAEDYKEAILDDFGPRDAHFNLANTYVKQGKYAQAIEHYNKVIQEAASTATSPSYGNALTNRAASRALSGDLEAAAREFRENDFEGPNRRTIEDALRTNGANSHLAFVGNIGNIGNMGLLSSGGIAGGLPGFPGGAGFLEPFRWPKIDDALASPQKLIQPQAMQNPPHPGGVVKRQCLDPLGLSLTVAARGLGVAPQALSELVNERTGVSVDIAVRLSKAFGSTPETWLGMQMAYDLWQARERADLIEIEGFPMA